MGKSKFWHYQNHSLRNERNLGCIMLREGFAMAHRKQRDPYTLKLLTQREKVKGTEQDRERER